MEESLSKSKIIKICIIFCLIAIGPILFMFTDPNKLPLPLVVLPFLWLFACLYLLGRLVLRLRTKANERQIRIIAGSIAGLPVLLLIFQSIHQLSIRDVLLSLGIVSLAAVYTLRADFIK